MKTHRVIDWKVDCKIKLLSGSLQDSPNRNNAKKPPQTRLLERVWGGSIEFGMFRGNSKSEARKKKENLGNFRFRSKQRKQLGDDSALWRMTQQGHRIKHSKLILRGRQGWMRWDFTHLSSSRKSSHPTHLISSIFSSDFADPWF